VRGLVHLYFCIDGDKHVFAGQDGLVAGQVSLVVCGTRLDAVVARPDAFQVRINAFICGRIKYHIPLDSKPDVPGFSGFGDLVVSMLAGSNPAESVGFFGRKKSTACLPSQGK
jgi:hypothetical protein